MISTLFLTALIRGSRAIARRLRERQRLARQLEELNQLSTRELTDLGITRAQLVYDTQRIARRI